MSAPHAWDANTRLRTDGVRLLLEAALKAGAEQYIQQSITMAYPDYGDEWITEEIRSIQRLLERWSARR